VVLLVVCMLGQTMGWQAAAVMVAAAVALRQQQQVRVTVLLAAALRGSCKRHLLD
jgi:hypothetical protein